MLQNYLQALTFANGILISADQDGKVFSWSRDAQPQAEIFKGDLHPTLVLNLANFNEVVYSASSDGTIKKSVKATVDGHAYEVRATLKLSGAPISVSIGNEKVLYVLQNNNKIAAIDVDTFTLQQEFEAKDYEPTALSYSAAGNEVWVGDKKGIIHVLDGSDFSQKTLIEKKHNHGISVMATSRDGKLVASGDSYRYIYVFNAETKEEVGCFPYHTSKIIGLDFNKSSTQLLTVGLDLTVGVANLADKTKKVVHRPNDKELTAAVFDDEDRFFTAGYDCSIRLWSK